jgi:hypothetical protein
MVFAAVISRGAVITCSSEWCVQVVSKSNTQSIPPSIVTPLNRDSIIGIKCTYCMRIAQLIFNLKMSSELRTPACLPQGRKPAGTD